MSTLKTKTHGCLREEIEAFYVELRRCGYREKSIEKYYYNFSPLQACARKHGIDAIGENLVHIFLSENGIDPDAGADDRSQKNKWRRRVAMALHHFIVHGEIPLRLARKTVYPGDWERVRISFTEFCKAELELSAATIRNRRFFLRDFALFMKAQRILSPRDLNSQVIKKYCGERLLAVNIRTQKTRANMAVSARSFMTYLLRRENGNPEWVSLVPRIEHAHVNTLPYIWTEEDIKSMLHSVDRKTSIGKRDFAILMLASRTGMRNSDICALRIDDIHWDDSSIRFFQKKTGYEQILPLTNPVGTALLEYFRDGRPYTKERRIFVRHQPRFAPLCSGYVLLIVQKYCRKLGIQPVSRRGIGMHAFRHTVASRMVEAGVDFETISGILGHTSLDTTKQYTRIDIDALRTAALDPEEAGNDKA